MKPGAKNFWTFPAPHVETQAHIYLKKTKNKHQNKYLVKERKIQIFREEILGLVWLPGLTQRGSVAMNFAERKNEALGKDFFLKKD